MGHKHLDIGVGTGYYPAHANLAEKDVDLTLMDLNPNTLEVASRVLNRPDKVKTLIHDATLPIENLDEKFDSISTFYLLHCMPGPITRKGAIFSNMKNHLKPDGVMYGTTVLGKGVKHNIFGRLWGAELNKRGIFDNGDDSAEGFTEILNKNFSVVETQVIGRVFIFKASQPKVDPRE